ncbi:MAG: cupin domain-containing protein [Gammaproteobacteria bacterium]
MKRVPASRRGPRDGVAAHPPAARACRARRAAGHAGRGIIAARQLAGSLALLALIASPHVAAHGDTAHGTHAPAAPIAAAAEGVTAGAASRGTRELVAGAVTIRMLLEQANLGDARVELGELTLPVAYGEGAAHSHDSLEIFYVIEGVLGHEVDGVAHRLEPGMVGFVRPGQRVRHAVLSAIPVRAVVVWLPGGEADRLVEHAGFIARPLPPP